MNFAVFSSSGGGILRFRELLAIFLIFCSISFGEKASEIGVIPSVSFASKTAFVILMKKLKIMKQ